MNSEILISVRPVETRVAYLDSGNVLDLKIERKTSPTLVGSILSGKVIRVLPGMQAAFVDVGFERAAFLYVADVRSEDVRQDETFKVEQQEEENSDPVLVNPVEEGSAPLEEPRPKIEELLQEGQKILVQVAKDPVGTKGARLTMHISLPGRSLVYMPTLQHVGISRRIEDEEERERLKTLVEQINPPGGVIVRTAGEGAIEEAIRSDLEYLQRLWKDIESNYRKKRGVGIIHAELSVELRALRDLLGPEVIRVLVDDKTAYENIISFVSRFMPKFRNTIELYQEREPLFDRYDIELEVSRALNRKVWLRSGGHIVIDEAEALTVVDVNTGRYVGKKDLEETILKINLEAIKEITHQLRLRNCGGIIIIDFIDMEKETHREKVLNSLREDLKNDPAKTTVVSMTSLGLVEMTRKRMRPSLSKTLCDPCPYCEGRGMVRKKATVAHEIFQAVEREALIGAQKTTTFVHCHSDVVEWVYGEGNEMVEYLEKKLGHPIAFKLEPEFHLEQFEVYSV